MPVLIDEVIAELNAEVTAPAEAHSPQQQVPAASAEQELLQTLALIQQRRDRLLID